MKDYTTREQRMGIKDKNNVLVEILAYSLGGAMVTFVLYNLLIV